MPEQKGEEAVQGEGQQAIVEGVKARRTTEAGRML
jgi:hypothetical protein